MSELASPSGWKEVWIKAGDVRLRCLTLGDPTRDALIVQHGLRDHAHSFGSVAEAVSDRHFVIVPDLRGHGASDYPGNYMIEAFLHDLLAIAGHFERNQFHLFGHSLGGHLASRFAAVYPDRVLTLTLVEGLGPPRMALSGAQRLALYASSIQGRMALPAQPRALRDRAQATERLRANNPRLNPARAATLVETLTREGEDGLLRWAFDPRAAQVFVATTSDEAPHFWRAVRCPTLVVQGALAHEYWGASDVPAPEGWDGRFHGDDLPSRLRCFRRLTFQQLANAGHMVHYDAPEQLARALRDFLGSIHG